MKPIKGLDPEPSNKNAVAGAFVDGVAKIALYLFQAFLFMGTCAMVAYVVMMSLHFMHGQESAVPPFGFIFIWSAIWGSSVLALFAGGLVKMAMKEDE